VGARLAQVFFVAVLAALLVPIMLGVGIDLKAALIVAGCVLGVLGVIVMIRPFTLADWEAFWEKVADVCGWLVGR
jgi:hypothetical protein